MDTPGWERRDRWGDEDYRGDLDFFVITTTYMYVANAVLGIRSNVVNYGQIDGYADCMERDTDRPPDSRGVQRRRRALDVGPDQSALR